jgi:hypothetical protein
MEVSPIELYGLESMEMEPYVVLIFFLFDHIYHLKEYVCLARELLEPAHELDRTKPSRLLYSLG